jgi:hypothetical protein
MTHKYYPFKVIHWDGLEMLYGQGWLDGILTQHYEVFPKTIDKDLPVSFRWTYRIHNDEKAIFSYICESKYLLLFDKGEFPNEAIKSIIKDSLLQMEVYWEDQTRNTQLQGYTIPLPSDEKLNELAENIISSAQQEGLL